MNKTPPSREEQAERNVKRMAKLTQFITLEWNKAKRKILDEEYDGDPDPETGRRKIAVSIHAANAFLGAHLAATAKSGDQALCRLAIEGFMEMVRPEMDKVLAVANGEEAE